LRSIRLTRSRSKIRVLFGLALLVFLIAAVYARPSWSAESPEGDRTATVDQDTSEGLFSFATQKGVASANPHNGFACDTCHTTPPARGAPFTDVLASLKGIPSKLCATCHSDYVNIHPSDKTPSMPTPPELPLDEKNHITCITCHNMHLQSSEFYLLRGFGEEEKNRFEARRDLCFDCHGEEFYLKNPHKAHRGSTRCAYCHLETPTAADTAKTVKFRVNVLQMCNFCHDVQRKFHPLNVDSEVKVPEGLPRGRDGSVHCGTCHNPHGVEHTVHFLRREYVKAVQGENKKPHGVGADCQACHYGRMVSGKKPRLRYEGNIVVLCNSCHGATGDLHPVSITIPGTLRRPTEIPLDDDGAITCLTCHSISCSAGSGKTAGLSEVRMRYFDRAKGDNTLCFFCHSREKWSGFSPHMEIDIRKQDYNPRDCRFCHDIDPSRGSDTADSVSFLPNPRMLCLRCHPERPHPAGYDHLVRPQRVRVPKSFPTDRDGYIVCTTCHDPHKAASGDSRKRELGDELCLNCHRK